MPKFLIFILILSPSALLAQKVTQDIYQMTGFTPPSEKEINTLFDESYLSLKRAADCRRQYMEKYKSQGQFGVQAACADADKFCGGTGMIDAKQRWVEDNFRSFLGSFTQASMASYGVDACQSTKFNYYKGADFNGKANGMSCWLQGAPGSEYNAYSKEFEEAHHALINNKKPKKSLESIAEKACKAFGEDNTNGSNKLSLVKYSPGHNGALVTRTVKDVESLKEALPLIHFSVVRNFEMGHDYVGSNSGSSNLGSDAVMKELEHDLLENYYKAYDGNRFTGFNDRNSDNPFFRMRGSKEGNTSEWNEKDNPGSAGVIFWEMCVVQDGSGKKPGLEQKTDPKPEGGDEKVISLVNENVSVELPDNVVSPFPLKVVDGKIVSVDISSTNKSGFIVPTLNKPVYAYGPRNSKLTEHDKSLMITGATAMSNKAKGFVDQVLGNPGEKIDLEKSSIVIASCSNHLRNQPGYKVWKTDAAPESRGKDDRISFEELSNQRSDAQYLVLTSLIKNELEMKSKQLDEEKKKLIAEKVKLSEGSVESIKLANKISYLEDQIKKISEMDVTKIKKNVVGCDAGGEKGVGGPNPYFNQLKDKFGSSKKWPVKSGSDSAYYLEVAQVSKDLKKLDIEDKLKKTKEALGALPDAPESQITSAVYKDWIKKYEDILAGKDGKPGYLNIPLLHTDSKFPCDISKPGENITCDIVGETSKSLDGFKVEKFMADVHMESVPVGQDIKDGWNDSEPAVYEPGGAKIFHAAAICNRKYEEKEDKKSKGKPCRSKATGALIDCETHAPWTGSKGSKQ